MASQVLLQAVLEAETYSQKKAAEDGRPPLEPAESLAVAMREGFINLDLNMRTTIPQLAQGIDTSGSTCVAAFVTPTHIVVANLGDSRVRITHAHSHARAHARRRHSTRVCRNPSGTHAQVDGYCV